MGLRGSNRTHEIIDGYYATNSHYIQFMYDEYVIYLVKPLAKALRTSSNAAGPFAVGPWSTHDNCGFVKRCRALMFL